MSAKEVEITNETVDLENKNSNTKDQSVDRSKESIANKTKQTDLEKEQEGEEEEQEEEEEEEEVEEEEEKEEEQEEEQEEEEEEVNKTKKEKEKGKEETDTNNGWMAVWDANAQAYYWWNTVTNETTWNNPNEDGGEEGTDGNSNGYNDYNTATIRNNPLDTLLDKIDSQIKTNLEDGGDNTRQDYSDHFNDESSSTHYASQAHFNARTGRFTTNEDVERLNPDQFTIENRATKQMSYYFDVDSYTEECNRQRQSDSGKKRSLSRKEVEYFKKMKKEKKSKRAREWLLQ